jgi:hypothetical protein
MPRVAGLIVNLAILLLAVGAVMFMNRSAWAPDWVLLWTAVLAVALSFIVSTQLVVVIGRSARARRARASGGSVPPRASAKAVTTHTSRFQRYVGSDLEAKRQREREESRRLNIAADIRRIHDDRSKW